MLVFGVVQSIMCILLLVIAAVMLTFSLRLHNLAAVCMVGAQIIDIPFKPFVEPQYLFILAFN
jgi:hypothetical protein